MDRFFIDSIKRRIDDTRLILLSELMDFRGKTPDEVAEMLHGCPAVRKLSTADVASAQRYLSNSYYHRYWPALGMCVSVTGTSLLRRWRGLPYRSLAGGALGLIASSVSGFWIGHTAWNVHCQRFRQSLQHPARFSDFLMDYHVSELTNVLARLKEIERVRESVANMSEQERAAAEAESWKEFTDRCRKWKKNQNLLAQRSWGYSGSSRWHRTLRMEATPWRAMVYSAILSRALLVALVGFWAGLALVLYEGRGSLRRVLWEERLTPDYEGKQEDNVWSDDGPSIAVVERDAGAAWREDDIGSTEVDA